MTRSAENSAELSRLRWRCRRGMQELDVILQRWLDRHWADADTRERADFERLLACEDDLLWRWLAGREQPDDPGLHDMVRRLGR